MRGNTPFRSESRGLSDRGPARTAFGTGIHENADGSQSTKSRRSAYHRGRPYSSQNRGRNLSGRFNRGNNRPAAFQDRAQPNRAHENGSKQGNCGKTLARLLKNGKPMEVEWMLELCCDDSSNALHALTSIDNAFHRRLNLDEPADSMGRHEPRECYILKVMEHALQVTGADTRVTKDRLIHSFMDSVYFTQLNEQIMKWKIQFHQRQAQSVIMLNLDRIIHIFLEVLRCSPVHFYKISAVVAIMSNVIGGEDNTADAGGSIMGSMTGRDTDIEQSIKNMIDDFSNLKECLLDLTEREERQAQAISGGERWTDWKLLHQDDSELEPPEDFRQMTIVPNLDDIFADPASGVFLRKNKVKGSYRNVQNYLDTQFRLLREDFISPLRDGIAMYLASKGKVGKGLLDDVRVYHGGKLIGSVFTKQGDLVHQISFDMTNLKRVKWEISKRFIHGSLLCLSHDNFRSVYFVTVYDRVVADLYKGRLSVMCESGLAEFSKLAGETDIIIVESVAYFEAYRHVLRGLQSFKNDEIPFIEHLVECNPKCGPPQYLNETTMMDFTCLLPLSDESQKLRDNLLPNDSGYDDILVPARSGFCILNSEAWPNVDDLGLDGSQYAALKIALTKKLALIQGPPGTGKTFIGFKIAQFLLANRSVWCGMEEVVDTVQQPIRQGLKAVLPPQSQSPILVVCYTNHALDQFLEGIMSFSSEGIIRIGGRCKNPAFAPFLLRNVRQQPQYRQVVPRNVRCRMYEIGCFTQNIRSELESIVRNINLIDDNILSADAIKQVASPLHRFSLFEYAKKAFGQFQDKDDDHILNTWLFRQEVHDIARAELLDSMRIPISEDNGETQDDEQAYADALGGCDRGIEPEDNDDDDWESIDDNPLRARVVKRLVHKSLVQIIKPKYAALQKALQKATSASQDNVENLWEMTMTQRISLYTHWKENFVKEERQRIESLEREYLENKDRLKEMTAVRDRHIMQNAQIIGMTTTGAAKYQDILQQIQPKIVIVEEAAEVLEAHILTCLSPGTQHLILIGDHKQLRPNPSVYALARKYNLEVSLFERLVSNNFEHATLDKQHRMRPEIADTLMPHFYEGLQNDISVYNYPDVRGIDGNIMFIAHNHLETDDGDSRSHKNEFEARYAVALANHLHLQEYNSSQITILVPYIGQMFTVKNIIKKEGWTNLMGIQVTCVDNFQGEENDIIILSLVRSNRNKKIGFLQTKNRVCVALSRAKMGLYCIGNFDLFAEVSDLWHTINGVLKEKGILGGSIRLKCEVHGTVSVVLEPSEFYKCAPEGGCLIPCTYRLDCGHTCRRMCHPIDRDHKEYSCLLKCQRTCPDGHPCKFTCDKCQPECRPCEVPVIRELPCGHSKQLMVCSADIKSYKCLEPCMKILSCGHKCVEKCFVAAHTQKCEYLVEKLQSCGHTIEVPCHVDPEITRCKQRVKKEMPICGHEIDLICSDINLIQVRCTHPCDAILACGHCCFGTCGQCRQGRLHLQCEQPCERTLMCGHRCQSNCCNPCPPCVEPCENKCEHRACVRIERSKQKERQKSKSVAGGHTCGEKCLPCVEKCSIKCRHIKCDKRCSQPCSVQPCNESCPKLLKCKHPCMGLCGQTCPKICKTCKPDDEVFEIFLGREQEEDARFVELVDCGHIFEVEDLDQWMALDNNDDIHNQDTVDTSAAKPVDQVSIGLKCCPKCKKPIISTLRYAASIKKTLAQIELAKVQEHGQFDVSVEEMQQEIWNILGLNFTFNIKRLARYDIRACVSMTVSSYSLARNELILPILKQFLESVLRSEKKHMTTDLVAKWKNYANWLRKLYALDSNPTFRRMMRGELPFKQIEPMARSLVTVWRQTYMDTYNLGVFPAGMMDPAITDLDHILVGELMWLCNWLKDMFCRKMSFQEAEEFDMEIRRCQILFDLGAFIASDEGSFKTAAKEEDINRLATIIRVALYGREPISEDKERALKSDLKDIFEKYENSLGLTLTEETVIIRAMGLPRGHWYECRNGKSMHDIIGCV